MCRETKQQPRRTRSGHQLGCCLVSLHFLCDIPVSHAKRVLPLSPTTHIISGEIGLPLPSPSNGRAISQCDRGALSAARSTITSTERVKRRQWRSAQSLYFGLHSFLTTLLPNRFHKCSQTAACEEQSISSARNIKMSTVGTSYRIAYFRSIAAYWDLAMATLFYPL